MTDPVLAATWVAAIAALGIVLDVIEAVYRGSVLDRFFHWKVTMHRYAWTKRGPLNVLTRSAPLKVFLIVQALAALATPFLIATGSSWSWVGPITVFAVMLLSRLRFLFCSSGADYMHSIVWGGLVVFTLSADPLVHKVALCFIVAQLLLSYVTAGWSKLASPFWRRGTAVGMVLRTETFGSSWAAHYLGGPRMSKAASWGTLVFEIGGPALVLFGGAGVTVFIAIAVLFHASIAVLMGLNRFVFAFYSTFPALYWASLEFQSLLATG